jgi:uncharacterized protein YifN (PemK superfamily)
VKKVITSGPVTVVILNTRVSGKSKLVKGMARCNPVDEYNRETGIKIATSRAKVLAIWEEIHDLEKRQQHYQQMADSCARKIAKKKEKIQHEKTRLVSELEEATTITAMAAS